MYTRPIYESGFDEETGRTLTKTNANANTNIACPDCTGSLETDGGETSCGDCGLIIDRYAVGSRFKRRPGRTVNSAPAAQNRRTDAPLTTRRTHSGCVCSDLLTALQRGGDKASLYSEVSPIPTDSAVSRWKHRAIVEVLLEETV